MKHQEHTQSQMNVTYTPCSSELYSMHDNGRLICSPPVTIQAKPADPSASDAGKISEHRWLDSDSASCSSNGTVASMQEAARV